MNLWEMIQQALQMGNFQQQEQPDMMNTPILELLTGNAMQRPNFNAPPPPPSATASAPGPEWLNRAIFSSPPPPAVAAPMATGTKTEIPDAPWRKRQQPEISSPGVPPRQAPPAGPRQALSREEMLNPRAAQRLNFLRMYGDGHIAEEPLAMPPIDPKAEYYANRLQELIAQYGLR